MISILCLKIVYGEVCVAVGSLRQYAATASAFPVGVAVADVRQYACAASAVVVGVGSKHLPNQPGVVHVVVVVASEVVVSLVVLSLHPNQPGC